MMPIHDPIGPLVGCFCMAAGFFLGVIGGLLGCWLGGMNPWWLFGTASFGAWVGDRFAYLVNRMET